ncbi:Clp protease N-terminal domain-containing protein [Pseudoalteromonas rhizosphaerae]|uniref:Clp protease N-terminal domain-containing protein n=1 Tax=Pseudoalteromonas rhizosphaerae TaxID=2518973 RepID=A0ABW8L1H9_9GAMM
MLYSFIRNIKTKIQDMKTISNLCLGAEKYANQYNEEKPGAEHFMLASLDLKDESVRNVFARLGVNPDEINQAIIKQHTEALAGIGIEQEAIIAQTILSEKIKPSVKLYDTKPSGQFVMQKIYQNNKSRGTRLMGVHVIEAILSMEYGIAIRALQAMNIDLIALQKSVETECNYM